jgi:hypothetical protein
MNNEKQPTLSTQGSAGEQEDQLGGTTNLSPEQLKADGGIARPSENSTGGPTSKVEPETDDDQLDMGETPELTDGQDTEERN